MTHSEGPAAVEYSFDLNAKILREHLNKMSFTDSRANKKNKVVKSQLTEELSRIDKQAQNDLRMYRNEQQRFKNKYSKYDTFSERRGTDASDVRMYETHIPGFCYRRNGDTRVNAPSTYSQSLDIEDLHLLLFTDGEVDIQKVMILHLLSAHRTDTLSPPPKICIAREQSPLERLVERSKKKMAENRLVKLLPTYVLDVSQSNNMNERDQSVSKETVKDARLSNRLILNDKIMQLCQTVLSALSRSNAKLFDELIDLSRNRERLKVMVNNPHHQEFVRKLSGLNLISSCESFYLTQPYRIVAITLSISTQTGLLENLVSSIRRNIFQIPSTDDWSIALTDSTDMSESSMIQLRKTAEAVVTAQEPPTPQKDFRIKYPVLSHLRRSFESLPTISEKSAEQAASSKVQENHPVIGKKSTRSKCSTDRKGSVAKTEDADEIEFDKYIRRTSKTLEKTPRKTSISLQPPVVVETSVKEEEKDFDIRDLLIRDPDLQTVSSEKEVPKNTQPYSSSRRTSLPGNAASGSEPLRTESLEKLNELIDKNKTKLQYYEKKFNKNRERRSSASSNRRGSGSSSGSNSPMGTKKNSSVEIVHLDNLDLAKIRHEIKVNETQKKLAKFLENQEKLNKGNQPGSSEGNGL